jgi:hypothetical protein
MDCHILSQFMFINHYFYHFINHLWVIFLFIMNTIHFELKKKHIFINFYYFFYFNNLLYYFYLNNVSMLNLSNNQQLYFLFMYLLDNYDLYK